MDMSANDVRLDPAWSTAVPDWERRIMARHSLVPTLPLYQDQADKAVRIFDRLRLPDVKDRPTMAESAGEWVRDIVRALFGAYDPEADYRHLQEVFLLVPKKNGKTTNAAAVMVTAMIMNPVHNAEGMIVAPTKDIAETSFNQARGMIQADESLLKKFHVQSHNKRITHRESGAFFQVKAADADVVTGFKGRYALIDEIHVFAEHARAADVFLEIRGALAAQPGGFLFMITTQAKRPPAGVFKAELQRARQVRDGKLRAPVLAVLYELPTALQEPPAPGRTPPWRDPVNFALVNPNLGRSARPEFLIRTIEEAETQGLDALALAASQYLNVEIGVGLSTDRWPGADWWQEAKENPLTLDALLARCEVVCVGVDGGGLDDLLAVAVLGREKETKRWLHWGRAFAHSDVLRQRPVIAARLQDFVRDGDLVLGDGPEDDIRGVVAIVEQVKASGLLHKVGLDPMGVGAIVDALADAGIGADQVLGVPQGWRLNAAIETTGRKLRDRTLVHADQPIMAWSVGNARCERRGNAVTITKQVSGSAKIDGLVALFSAVALMSTNPQPLVREIEYERGGIFA